MHRCFWASTRSCTCDKFKKLQYSGSHSLIQVIKDDCKLNELKDDCKLQTHSYRKGTEDQCVSKIFFMKSFYWSLNLNFWSLIALKHAINANGVISWPYLDKSFSHHRTCSLHHKDIRMNLLNFYNKLLHRCLLMLRIHLCLQNKQLNNMTSEECNHFMFTHWSGLRVKRVLCYFGN